MRVDHQGGRPARPSLNSLGNESLQSLGLHNRVLDTVSEDCHSSASSPRRVTPCSSIGRASRLLHGCPYQEIPRILLRTTHYVKGTLSAAIHKEGHLQSPRNRASHKTRGRGLIEVVECPATGPQGVGDSCGGLPASRMNRLSDSPWPPTTDTNGLHENGKFWTRSCHDEVG